MNDCKSLLVLRTNQHLSKAQIESLTDLITPTADALGAEPMVLGSGYDAELKTDTSAILSRIADALERIVAQGEPPTVSEAEIAPQSLNARSRDWPIDAVCKGAAELGTACGQCDRCHKRGSYAEGLSNLRPKPPTAGLNSRG